MIKYFYSLLSMYDEAAEHYGQAAQVFSLSVPDYTLLSRVLICHIN